MKKIKLNNDLCIGCGACTAIASSIFDFSDEGYAKVIDENCDFDSLDDEKKEEVTDALESCPVTAISIEE